MHSPEYSWKNYQNTAGNTLAMLLHAHGILPPIPQVLLLATLWETALHHCNIVGICTNIWNTPCMLWNAWKFYQNTGIPAMLLMHVEYCPQNVPLVLLLDGVPIASHHHHRAPSCFFPSGWYEAQPCAILFPNAHHAEQFYNSTVHQARHMLCCTSCQDVNDLSDGHCVVMLHKSQHCCCVTAKDASIVLPCKHHCAAKRIKKGKEREIEQHCCQVAAL